MKILFEVGLEVVFFCVCFFRYFDDKFLAYCFHLDVRGFASTEVKASSKVVRVGMRRLLRRISI